MFRTSGIFILLCFTSFVFVSGEHDHKVNVAVYYESLCPDSIAFVTKQLYPALEKPEINKHVNLTLVPYGKSMTNKTNTKDIKFTCHHGEMECKGNKIHACALNRISPEMDGSNKIALGFINCLLGQVKNEGEKTKFPVMQCVDSEKVPSNNQIETCADSSDGSMLLDGYGQKTKRLQDPLNSVPTITFNDKLNADDSKAATSKVKLGAIYEEGSRLG
ncbi:gamma-interferon inducible lysosomal thiol reductase gilt [Holotrichia oblita]|uniref:Gamma-interferon inducible lysosomal thiol reductase gilt n=1 Tax=Holotrichia oblita TaxID=644536 RepID=A0ACB9SJA2_HOLOL|nr:gamma-interferon inducible lysosomal thiol reductase gilt [Holotrichia oblita]